MNQTQLNKFSRFYLFCHNYASRWDAEKRLGGSLITYFDRGDALKCYEMYKQTIKDPTRDYSLIHIKFDFYFENIFQQVYIALDGWKQLPETRELDEIYSLDNKENKSPLTKKDFAESIIKDYCCMRNIYKKDMDDQDALYSSRVAVAMEFLGMLKSEWAINYAAGRAGIIDIVGDDTFPPAMNTVRDVLDTLPDE